MQVELLRDDLHFALLLVRVLVVQLQNRLLLELLGDDVRVHAGPRLEQALAGLADLEEGEHLGNGGPFVLVLGEQLLEHLVEGLRVTRGQVGRLRVGDLHHDLLRLGSPGTVCPRRAGARCRFRRGSSPATRCPT